MAYPIYQAKYYDHPEIAVALGELIGQEMMDVGFLDGVEVIVPVAISKQRKAQRGYNQSERIAQGIANVTGLSVVSDVLERKSFKMSQTKLSTLERMQNVKGAFSVVKGERLKGKRLLLVDDVITTGATLCEAAMTLGQIEGVKITVATVSIAERIAVALI